MVKRNSRDKLIGVFVFLMTVVLFPPGVTLASTPTATAPGQQSGSEQGWRDNFDGPTLDARWTVSGWGVPGYIPNNHRGFWDANNVSLQGGYLVLRLTQERGRVDRKPRAVISSGALVASTETYGYGTYEWRMRMTSTATDPTGIGSPVSGSVSAGFVYVNNSETEITIEYGGHVLAPNDPGDQWADTLLYMVNWHNTDPSSDPAGDQQTYDVVEVPGINDMFRRYKFVWEPERISFYVDDMLKAVHTTNVPSAPAHFMINHWGTNNPNWGGEATLGVDRYFYIDWVSYTPLTNDTDPPVISGVRASSISASGATISWTTDEPGDSQVEYGETTAYGHTTPLEPSLVTNHAQTLSGLLPDTAYHYRVRSTDAVGNLAVSGDHVATTAELPDSAPPDTTITSGPSGEVFAGDLTFTWTGADNVTPPSQLVYAFRLHPLEPSFSAFSTATSKDYTGLALGAYTFYVKAQDEVGQEDPTPAVQSFTLVNPLPTIVSLVSPSSIPAGASGLTLTVFGSGFILDSVVRWNASDRSTTFVSASQLTAIIPTSDISAGGTAEVTVFNPAPGGGTSSPVTFGFSPSTNLEPTLTALSPASAVVGEPGLRLTVNGLDFATDSVVRWNGTDLSTRFLSGNQVVASIPAGNLSRGGLADVTVFNLGPNDGVSNSLKFAITDSFIQGRITDHRGVAVAGAMVTAYAGTNLRFSTTTARDGTYTLAMVAGTYDLVVSKVGFASRIRPQLRLRTSQTHRHIDLRLVPRQSAPGRRPEGRQAQRQN